MARGKRMALGPAMLRRRLEAGTYSDSAPGGVRGLVLVVRESGASRWQQRVTVRRRRRTPGLGSFPRVSLADARALALQNLRLAHAGVDPITARARGEEPTFRVASDRAIARARENWTNPRTETNWRNAFERYVHPTFGDRPVSSITASECLEFLVPLAVEHPRLARHLRGRMAQVFHLAQGAGHREDNPAGPILDDFLTFPAAVPRRALPHAEVARALRVVRASAARPTTRLVLEFIALTAARSGEACGARWSEVDLDDAIWRLPPERVKNRCAFSIPLSSGALHVLAQCAVLRGDSDSVYVFPSSFACCQGPVMTKSVSNAFFRLPIPAQVHGFRSSFRDWCADTGVVPEVAEACLNHSAPRRSVRPYRRVDLAERRRAVMQAWSRYVGAPAPRR